MKAIICKQHGLPNLLEFEDILDPKPNDDQVLIEIKACSANFPDTLIIQNLYQFKPELPFSPGSEVSGDVIAIGKNVKNFKLGQRVLALCGWGGFAEQIAVDANKVFPIADDMDYVTAASLMYNFGTSYHALKDRANLLKGETLLVLGAAGGVGLAAVELGKLMGATVIAAASSHEKLTICQEKGADFLINYEIEDLKERIKEITKGRGVNVVYDPIGDKYAEPCIRAMAWKGRYLVVGFAAGQIPKIALNLALLKGCSIMGVFWGHFATIEAENNLKNIKELANFIAKGLISPHIYKLYTLENAPQALEDLMNRKVVGKAVVVMSDKALIHAVKTILIEQKQFEKRIINSDGKVIFTSFEQINAFVGQSFGTTDWLAVTQEMINEFANATLDRQWIHVDSEKAKQSIFGQTIAHGLLTLLLTPKFMYELYEVKNSKMGINYGTDKVRFLSPVLSGSNLRMSAILKETAVMPNNGLKMIIEATIAIENQKKPACVAELISIVYM